MKYFGLLFSTFLLFGFSFASYVENQVLVQYAPSGMGFFSTDSDSSESSFEVLELSDGETVEDAIVRLQNQPGVAYVQPNYVYTTYSIPNDPWFNQQWSLNNIGQTVDWFAGSPWSDISWLSGIVLFSWISDQSVTGTLIALIDDGVNYNHVDLQWQFWDGSNCLSYTGAMLWWCIVWYDFYDDDLDPAPNGLDNHGTHIAGVIAANMNNSIGIVWVNPNAKIMALRAWSGNTLSTSEIIKAIQFAQYNGARIINASFGGSNYDHALYTAMQNFPGIIITAAGNGTIDGVGFEITAGSPIYPCAFNLSNSLCIAATDANDDLTVYSNFSDTYVDLTAPCSRIIGTYGINQYAFASGTSSSVPLTVGIASLAWSMYPDSSYQDIIASIISWSVYIPSLEWQTIHPRRVDLYGSLLYLQEQQTSPSPFTFDVITWVLPNMIYTSNIVTITGIEQSLPVWVFNGEYSINGGVWSGAGQTGYINSGDTLQLRFTPLQWWVNDYMIVYVGSYSTEFWIETTVRDIDPDPFTFTSISGTIPGFLYESNIVTIAGINTGAYVTVNTGWYSINGGLQTWDNTTTGIVYSGDTLQVSFVAPHWWLTDFMWITVWDYTTDFSLESLEEWFVFDSLTGVLPLTVYESDVVTLTWFVGSLDVIINNGEYRINAWSWTAHTWSIVSWNTLQVRTTSSWVPNQFDGAYISVGDYVASFLVASMESWLLVGESVFFTGDRRHYNVTWFSLFVESDTGVDYRIFGQNLVMEYAGALWSDFNEIALQLNGTTGITYIWTVLGSGGDERYFTDYVVYDIQAPVLESFSLTSGQTVYGTSVFVTGIVSDDFALDVIPWFDLDCDTSATDVTECTFSWQAELQSWNFSIVIHVYDKAWNFDQFTIPLFVDQWDRTPDAFTFAQKNNVARSTAISSDVVTVVGIDTGVVVSVSVGEYRINEWSRTSSTGLLYSGDDLQLRLTSSSSYNTTVSMDVNVWSYDTSFSVRTESAPSPPPSGCSWCWWWWDPDPVSNNDEEEEESEEEIDSSTWDTEEIEIVYELFDTTSVSPLSATALVIPQSAQCAGPEELQQAYQFAYGIGITTMPTASQARLCDGVTRAEMAKMMVNYAQSVTTLSEDSSRACNFDDISTQPAELQWYIVQACKLGIMGVGISSFYPNASVDRWQFGTALSRVLYEDLYNDSDPYYMSHLAALYNANIITNMTPSLQELRGYVMLMMMRAAE